MQDISLDALICIFSKTFGSLKGSWGLVFASIIACKYQLDNPKIHIAVVWALVVTVIVALNWLNRSIVSRGSTCLRPGDLVVITGAASGLGFYLTAVLSQTNPVLAIDVKPLPLKLNNVRLLKIDCADSKSVATALKGVEAHTLINCAGVVRGGNTLDLSEKDIKSTYAINTLGPLWTSRELLPHMIKTSGYIVNVSSSTSYVGPGKAGIYAASKAALRIWHESLTQELRGTPVKTILVIPGQLDTPMFDQVETPDKFLAPVVSATSLGDEIVDWLRNGKAGHIITPIYARALPLVMNLFPQSVINLLRRWNGLDNAMDNFKN